MIGSLGRAIEELVRNAVEGGRATSITVTLGRRASPATTYLEVEDNGIGIDSESLRRYVGTENCTASLETERRQSTLSTLASGESLRSISALSVEVRLTTSALQTSRKRNRASSDARSLIVQSQKCIREGLVVSFDSSIQLSSPISDEGQYGMAADLKTGTSVAVIGLFHRYSVRRRQHQREHSKRCNSKSNSNDDANSFDRAELAQAKVCLRTIALAYPLVSIRLMIGKTGAVDSIWEVPIDARSSSLTRFDSSLPVSSAIPSKCSSSHDDTRHFVASLSRRLEHLVGRATSSMNRTISVVYEEDISSLKRPLLRTGSLSNNNRRSRCPWTVFGAIIVQPDPEDNCTPDHDTEQGRRKRTRRNRQLEYVFINQRPSRHGTSLGDVITSACSACVPNATALFVLHVTCDPQEVDLVVDEKKKTVAVPRRDRMELLLKNAVIAALANHGYASSKSIRHHSSQDSDRKYAERRAMSAVDKQRVAPSGLVTGAVALAADCHESNSSVVFSPFFKGKSRFTETSIKEKEDVSSTALATVEEQTSPASPFTDAFFNQELAPLPLSERLSHLNTSDVRFEQAFLASDVISATGADGRSDDTTKGEASRVGTLPAISGDSMNWTRTRLRALASQVASIASNASNMASAGSGTYRRPISLSKEMLANSQVVAQVDKKFIVVNCGGLICIVDQHAADERVGLERLEQMLDAELNADEEATSSSRSSLLRSVPLLPAQTVSMSPSQVSTIAQHKALLIKWRFSFQTISSSGKELVALTGVPGLFRKVANRQDFVQFVQALEMRTSDAALVRPAFVKRVLASRACRFAIMFGDFLPHDECVKLIRQLSVCKLCFICAHGRPSVIPLLDIGALVGEESSLPLGGNARSATASAGPNVPLRFQARRRIQWGA